MVRRTSHHSYSLARSTGRPSSYPARGGGSSNKSKVPSRLCVEQKKAGAAANTARNRNFDPSASRNMFLLLSLLSLVVKVVAGPLQLLEAQPLSTLSTRSDLSAAIANDACQVGKRSILQDVQSLNQTLLWEIGTIKGSDGEQFCRTVMRMDYDRTWQYGVTEIDWRSNAEVEGDSQAAITLLFNFENSNRIVSLTTWLKSKAELTQKRPGTNGR
jgi:hypothetical protein